MVATYWNTTQKSTDSFFNFQIWQLENPIFFVPFSLKLLDVYTWAIYIIFYYFSFHISLITKFG